MDVGSLEVTRRSLHAVAEYVLAGPQYAERGDIRLRVVGAGMQTMGSPDLRVEAAGLVTPSGVHPLAGAVTALASVAGVTPRDLRDVYAVGPELGLDAEIVVDEEAASQIMLAFERGDAAMRELAPDELPVLWPEHFDIGISVDEVNYGVSPGDAEHSTPYAYVGPWVPRTGPFWNASFGAARPMAELPTTSDVLEFFAAGAAHAAEDPLAD